MKKLSVLVMAPVLVVVLASCMAGGHDGETQQQVSEVMPELVGPTWSWVASWYGNDTRSEPGAEGKFTVVFKDDGTCFGKADCNSFHGSYTRNGSSLRIKVGAMTKAMCPRQDLADMFLRDLAAGAIFFFRDGRLLIDLQADVGTMELAVAAADNR